MDAETGGCAEADCLSLESGVAGEFSSRAASASGVSAAPSGAAPSSFAGLAGGFLVVAGAGVTEAVGPAP